MSGALLMDVQVGRVWENVDLVRESLLQCCKAVLSRHAERAQIFATMAAELMENAVKYGHWRDLAERMRVRVSANDTELRVEVENPVDPSSNDTIELLRTLDWLKAFPSREHAYHAKLMDVAASPLGTSKLGLARIAYEGDCDLHAEIVSGVLRVSSATRL